MSADKFKALIAEGNSSAYKVAFKELTNDELPKEDVLASAASSAAIAVGAPSPLPINPSSRAATVVAAP